MRIIKENFVDLLATLVIIGSIFFSYQALTIVIWIYTGLLLLAKLIGVFTPSLVRRTSSGNETPNLFYHGVYIICIAAFLYLQDWYLSSAWFVIWVLSWYSFVKGQQKTVKNPKSTKKN